MFFLGLEMRRPSAHCSRKENNIWGEIDNLVSDMPHKKPKGNLRNEHREEPEYLLVLLLYLALVKLWFPHGAYRWVVTV